MQPSTPKVGKLFRKELLMKNLGINISHNGPYTNVSTAPLCFSQTVRNIAVPMILSSKQRIITVNEISLTKTPNTDRSETGK